MLEFKKLIIYLVYMFEFYKNITCTGLRYPKIFHFKDVNYLIGSRKYQQEDDITKYGIYLLELDDDFNIVNEGRFIELEDYKYLHDLTKSAWIRDVNINDDKLFLNVEIKQNVNNNRFFHENFLVSTNDCIYFSLIKKYEVNDFLFKELYFKNDHYLFSSKIEEDLEDINFNWGKYLFVFFKNNEIIKPVFDKIVDYEKDKGHVMHNVVYNEANAYFILYFSIRHKVEKDIHSSGFIYKIYTAKTKDLVNYYDTEEVKFINKELRSEWFSYPHYFTYKNEEYIICNQDDYGKNLEPVIFKKHETLEEFVANQYQLQEPHNLKFTTDLNYIYYNELVNKLGKRYEYIQNNHLDIQKYSNYAPSCRYLTDLLRKLNITSHDSILDIGSGWGYALSVFNLFPFKNITGIEIGSQDVEICKNNIYNVLHLQNINIINDSILNFKDYDLYNYFYLYNPFSEEIFKIVSQNIPANSIVIYKNIHDNEKNILLEHNFEFIFEHEGEERNYFIFRKK